MINPGRFFIIGICAATTMLTVNAQEASEAKTKAVAARRKSSLLETQFANLVRTININGLCEVNNPDKDGFEMMKHGKAYPMGSTFRTGPDSHCIMIFSAEDSATIEADSELIVTACTDDAAPHKIKSLTVKLIRGTLKTNLRDNLADGSFTVNTPNGAVKNMSGRAAFTISNDGGNETFLVQIITGSSMVEGPHYTIPSLQAANKLQVITSANRSFSWLTSVSGDFAIHLPDGDDEPVIFSMSPKAVVKLWREIAPVGGRTIVSALVVNPKGIARHRFVYAVGREEVATGELVQTEQEEAAPDDLPLLMPTPGSMNSNESNSGF